MVSDKARTLLLQIETRLKQASTSTEATGTQDAGKLGDDAEAADAQDLLPLIYSELRGLAQRVFRGPKSGHTLQPTALVHEAYIRLIGADALEWNSRTHFLNIASRAMRQVLVDHHREGKALKRGGDRERVTLSGAAFAASLPGVDAVALKDALEELESRDERQCRVVELRFFAGLSMEEIAEELGVSLTTVEGEWRHARAWLHRKLAKGFQ